MAAEEGLRALLAASSLRAADSVVADVVQYDLERMSDDGSMRVLSLVEGRAAAVSILDALLPGVSRSMEAEWSGLLCFAPPSQLRERHDAITLRVGVLADTTTDARVTAVAWIDRETGAVAAVTPPDVDPRAPSPEASIDLALLPTGHVVLRSWRLAVPTDSSRGARIRGGSLAAVSVRGLPATRFAVPTIRVRLVSAALSLHGVSLAVLDGGPIADFDAGGNAAIRAGVEGDYFVEVSAPELEELGVRPTVLLAHARTEEHMSDPVALPLLSDLRQTACGFAADDASGVLMRLQTSVTRGSAAPPMMRIRRAAGDSAGATDPVGVRDDADEIVAATADGRAIWCAARASGPWVIEVREHERMHRQLVQAPSTALDTTVIVGTPADASSATEAIARSRAVLRVAVVDSSGARLPSVSVRLHDSTGARIDGRVGVDGTVSFRDLPVMPMRLDARALGYAPGSVDLRLDEGENEVTMILTRNLVVQLDPVYIRELPSLLSRLGEFERRRRYGFAAAMYTAEDIFRRNPIDTWQLFQATASIRLTRDGGGIYAISMRGQILQREGAMGNCVARVAVDGVFLAHPANLEDLPRPAEIYGIEIYAGPATIPLEYRMGAGSKCGLILVWTK